MKRKRAKTGMSWKKRPNGKLPEQMLILKASLY